MDADRSLFPRSLTPVLREALADTPVVCLLGPRQSGKTTLAQQLAPDRAFVSLDEHNYYQTAGADPDGFVASLPEAVTLDEVQRVPVLLSAIKRAVDQGRRPGRFLLTGSANLLLVPTVTESLAGRMEMAQLHPLTEAEKERQSRAFPQRPAERHAQTGYPAQGGACWAVAARAASSWRLSRAADPYAQPRPAMASSVCTQHHRAGCARRGAG